ncbi:hypothetical protein V5P93_002420 [Actinokineospora auranticolor]|uniref:IrrE N-terminal-like domain-containing protein n=1 Tax=Actinokineospora auranticolor TaxID=155976 RepID=A0A2S6GMY8_9PSEU|nr:hypothetical protein [Actinokineospora auranticolor]PPK66550.1 hypothetical protein CLV40_110254 [Actinokineospora auranticolor]
MKSGGGRALRRDVLARLRPILSAIEADKRVDGPFDVHRFCAAVARHRGKPLRLVPMGRVLPAGQRPSFTGLWVGTRKRDFILYDDGTAPLLAQHSILHELGHMLLDHGVSGGLDAAQWTVLLASMPDLDPVMVRRAVLGGRCRGDTAAPPDEAAARQEREAEIAAEELFFRYCASGVVEPPPRLDPEELEVLRRLAAAFGAELGPS